MVATPLRRIGDVALADGGTLAVTDTGMLHGF
jgi:hypothetical protein